ncbi:MAG: hypothetical protein QW367_01005 [Candidatus Aenigmatarchaeota archaeon]
MKKFLIIILLFFFVISFAFAHSEDAELNAEIQKGKELFEKLQQGKITCQDLTNEDFHAIGEYAMELMVGGSDHLLMNQMMERMHGKEAEEQMHINMGKRFSGCETGYNRSTWMMGPMMGYWGWWNFSNWKGWSIFAPIFAIVGVFWMLIILVFPILVLILLILGIIYLIKRLKERINK